MSKTNQHSRESVDLSTGRETAVPAVKALQPHGNPVDPGPDTAKPEKGNTLSKMLKDKKYNFSRVGQSFVMNCQLPKKLS